MDYMSEKMEWQDRCEKAEAALQSAYDEGFLQHTPGCSGKYPGYRCKCGLLEFLETSGIKVLVPTGVGETA